MKEWNSFENDCFDYVKERFGKYALFSHAGGSDSTVSDIKVKTRNNREFYIEAKFSPAQCGQFVLLPNPEERQFEYSYSNKNPIYRSTQKIIDYMNNNFLMFNNPGTGGVNIVFPNCKSVFYRWVIDNYKHKNTEYIITNGFNIIKLEEISKHFDISCTYRVKRSGSGDVGLSRIDTISDSDILSHYGVDQKRKRGSKLFVTSKNNINNKRFTCGGYEYMFSLRNSEYEVRRLSNTFNANVIFSISLFNESGLSDNEFIKHLL